jgi:hypothetical protein
VIAGNNSNGHRRARLYESADFPATTPERIQVRGVRDFRALMSVAAGLSNAFEVLAQKLFQSLACPEVEDFLKLFGGNGGGDLMCIVHLGLLKVGGRHNGGLTYKD